jgi:ABC-2 type transport system ATP-binding protein
MSSGPRLAPKRRIAPRRGDASAARGNSRGSAGETVDELVRISTRGLTKQYGELTAVDALDLDVRAGEIFGLLGQNGAGKTTTILMLLGLTEPTAGQARVVGLDPARRPLEVKRRVGYMPDSVGFYSDLSGRENLRYTARLNRIPRDEAEAAIDEVLEQVGLTNRADDLTDTYSRGMLQRLGIADALVKDPDVLILDEPTTAIDPLGVTEILDLLRDLVRQRQMAILLSSHLLNQVQVVCDRIGIFAAGKLIGQGSMTELAERFGDGTARIEVGFEFADKETAKRAPNLLRAIPDVVEVRQVERTTDPWIVAVRPPAAEGRVRQAILTLAAAEGLGLVSLRPIVPSLEEIYRHAVARTLPAHAGAVR